MYLFMLLHLKVKFGRTDNNSTNITLLPFSTHIVSDYVFVVLHWPSTCTHTHTHRAFGNFADNF